MLSTRLKITTAFALTSLFLCVLCINNAHTQENAQVNIPPSLVECYNTSYFMNRDNRLPSNINTLISIIEKVENSYNFNQDMRQLAVSLLHRFRQDGIERAHISSNAPGVIPFSPRGFQFPKFRLLLARLIPGNALNFPNDTLSQVERCSLHFMLSSSFDTRVRGDEGQVCNKLSQYRAERLPRAIKNYNNNNRLRDVELLENYEINSKGFGTQNRQVQAAPEPSGFDFGWTDTGTQYDNGNSKSQCPVENGVIWTPWGSVSAGTLIAGIAAGLQPQTVQLRTLLALARRQNSQNLPQTTVVNVDNRWAATLAGDLAEVALVQVPLSGEAATATVGANGAWNSTVMPKWYFLSQRQNLEMTDAEIRGGIDGLILAMNISTWRTQASTLKLSQLLRMYYSMDGVLDSGIKACGRKDNFPNVAPLDKMTMQAAAFARVLDGEMQLKVTLQPDTITKFAKSAAEALTSYVPQNLNDISCSVSGALPQDISNSITAMTDLYLFLDTSWQYYDVNDYVAQVLQNLNIGQYASTVTLLAASDGSIIVNTTDSVNFVFQNWNATTHTRYTPGFSLPSVLRKVQNLTQDLMNGQKANSSVGGRSLVALLMPNSATVNSGDSSYSNTQLQTIYEQIPDLYFIYYSGGMINRFESFVRQPSQDLFSLNIGTKPPTSANPVVMRIKNIPRRIINPRCGSTWSSSGSGSDSLVQYVGPNNINFYRIAPNYFFGSGSNRYVNIQPQNALQFNICTSRSTVLPVGNDTNSDDVKCTTTNGKFSYDLSSSCKGNKFIHSCSPLYLSVSANNTFQTVSCSQPACQTPDQSSYTITVENLGCWSGVSGLVASFFTISFMYLILQFSY